jgi:hypothetical protein
MTFPAPEPDSGFSASLCTRAISPFAIVTMGDVTRYAYTPEQCDAGMRAWAEAKALLQSAQVTR